MATDSFKFWTSYRDSLRKLEPSDGYRLVMAMCDYAFDGIEPDFEPGTPLDYTWTPIRDQVAESVRISRSKAEAGRKSGESRRKKSGKRQSEHSSNTVQANGMERNGMEDIPFHGMSGASLGSLSSDPLAPGERPTYAEYIRQLGGEGQ